MNESERLKQAEAAALEASRIKSTFMAKISHDLRSPLNGIIGFAELLYHEKVGTISGDQKEYLGDILASARQLLLLINDVVDLAKIESGKMQFNAEPVDFTKILNETRGIFKSLIETKKINFTFDVDPALKNVNIDPGRFKQVLYNFVSNALKCTEEGGHVTVHIQKDKNEKKFQLIVEDTGIGIRPEDIKKLFIEFQQLDKDIAKKYAGTGLGLALAKHIVEAQGGEVGVKSTFGKGSTFFAILPKEFSSTN